MRGVGYCGVKIVRLTLLSPSFVTASLRPVLDDVPVVAQGGVLRELLLDFHFHARRLKEPFEIVCVDLFCEVQDWKFMLTSPRCNHGFKSHSTAYPAR